MTREEAKREILFAKREVMADSWIDKAYDVAIKALEQPEQKWIPCTPDTMPDDYTDVLVWLEYYRYGDYNCLYQTYGIGSYSTEYDSWMINHETGWRKLRVIAWMPLPEPYKPPTRSQYRRMQEQKGEQE